MLGITARQADEWNTWGSPGAGRRAPGGAAGGLRQGRAGPGHDADLGQRLHRPGRGRAAARPRHALRFGRGVVDQLGQYAELGFDEFILPDWNLGPDALDDTLARIKTEVMDQLPA